MPNKTSIEWTDYSSNPIYAVVKKTGKRGWHCTHASEGCRNCYAEAINKRFGTGLAYTAQNTEDVRFELSDKECDALRKLNVRCRKLGIRQKVFIGDMLDLFHPAIGDDLLNLLFSGTLEICSSLTFQILTKRSDRMREYLNWRWGEGRIPSRNIHIGVSVEDEPNANRRIVDLLDTRAAIRFLSIEPLLGPVNLINVFPALGCSQDEPALADIHWVIVGGESGQRARGTDLAWIRLIANQCKDAGVPVFVKQLGAWPYQNWPDSDYGLRPFQVREGKKQLFPFLNLKSNKGGDPSEWPEDLRIREFPEVAHA
jgi:protein gp37